MKAQFTMGAFGIILDSKNRVLLCHRTDRDAWNCPGGGIELGETPSEAVVREVKEETGFDIEIVRLIGVYTKKTKNDIVFSFLCKVTGGQITLNDEADKIEYFDMKKFPENMVSENHLERIMDALADMPFAFKKQDSK